ncbi:Acg family FMN-binding oxidoreductase [Pseudonocardia endophytica]|uniref:Nitroreductase family protein n=1 Tax=Pseudonocardia endophytica TaxID=401976 RepID=A0A4R1HXQ8_PSEEN|nr:nitroreductase [Pseudonocardia endophytica]TCK22342.1 nitroreductase family protein [Pseudonocardia endophytica]
MEALGLTASQVEGAVATAARAPSLHNSQPWRFHVRPDVIELRADPARRLPVADPDGVEMRVACGAALFTLRLALIELGVRPLVSVLPDRDDPALVAAVRHGGRRTMTPDLRHLRDAVGHRRTNRHPFTGAEVGAPEQLALRRAALDEGAWLYLVSAPEQRAALGRLARAAHLRQLADPAFTAELAAWTGHDGGRDDGVPARAGGPAPAPNQAWVVRDFSGGTAAPATASEPDPLIGVLSVHTDGPREDVRAGAAMQRVLLTATVHGLSASFLSQLVELPDVREQVRRLLGGTRPPRVVMRFGHGVAVPGTPRRATAEIVDDT